MTSTPQDPGGSPPQWNPPGQQQPPSGSYPDYPGASQQQGASQYGPQQYGSPQYGAQQYPSQQYGSQYDQGGNYQPGGAAMKRPGTVTAAAIITMVMSAITGGFWLLLGIAFLAGGDSFTDDFLNEPEGRDLVDQTNLTDQEFRDAISAFGVGALVAGLLMLAVVLVAIGVLRGSNVARILLVICSVLTLLISFFFIPAYGLGLLWMAAAVAVIALLFVGGASSWFASKRR
jgi:hypothetical protein